MQTVWVFALGTAIDFWNSQVLHQYLHAKPGSSQTDHTISLGLGTSQVFSFLVTQPVVMPQPPSCFLGCIFMSLVWSEQNTKNVCLKVVLFIKEWEKKSTEFSTFKKAQEMREECKGLNLGSLLITPVQRVPRYFWLRFLWYFK